MNPMILPGATLGMLIMFGVLGGVVAFGLAGLFIRVVILAVALAVWREWLEDSRVETKTT